MVTAPNISSAIVESLYSEALQLADEARFAFDMSGSLEDARMAAIQSSTPDASRVLSCEALRATTRMMHTLAWLLNQRAFFAGQLSRGQLRRNGGLPEAQPASDPSELALLDDDIVRVVEQTRLFYARIARIDADWRDQRGTQQRMVHQLRDRLGSAFAAP